MSKIKAVAQRIKSSKEKGDDLVVVVSAMGHQTDELSQLASEITVDPPPSRNGYAPINWGTSFNIIIDNGPK